MFKNKTAVGFVSISLLMLLQSCASTPKNAQPVKGFEVNRYLGTWYEIARIDFKFERDLDNTSAQYKLDAKGNISVLNSGYNFKKKKWTKAEGKAKFRGDQSVAALKVSFFGPFYGGYNVIALDENYKYAMVAGKDYDYLWILSREKTIPLDYKNRFLDLANAIGYDTTRLLWVKHDKKNPYINAQ